MKFDRETILHIEQLAHIELSEGERTRLSKQLSRIVSYCEELQQLDTGDVEPTSTVVQVAREELRDDESAPGLDRDVILDAAPDARDGYFWVPKIIER